MTKILRFKEEAKILFEIAVCKCKDNVTCTCSKELKVPIEERAFLADQRADRKMMIGSIDKKKTVQLQRREKRNQRECERALKFARTEYMGETKNGNVSSSSSEEEHEPLAEKDGSCEESFANLQKDKVGCQNRKDLPSLAKACDSYGVSDRAAAGISTAVLQDYGLVSRSNRAMVIDRSKVR